MGEVTRLDEVRGYAVGLTLTEGLAPGERLADVEFEDCRLERLSLERAVLSGVAFESCAFVGVDLSMCSLLDVRFADCAMRDGKALAVSWASVRGSGMAATTVAFEGCRLDFGSFADTDLRGMSFTRCSLREADLTGADLRGVAFTGCDLSGAQIARADLRGAALIESHGFALDLGSCRVSGLTVDAAGALDLVAGLGVDVL